MRGKLMSAARVFLAAYIGAAGWVLAGCGWGLVVGSVLEAAFGRGTPGLLDSAGETSLEATAGALAGMAAGVLSVTLCLAGALFFVAALLDKFDGLTQGGKRGDALLGWHSTRLGTLLGLAFGVCIGTSLGPFVGATTLIDSIHGRPFSSAFVQVSTRLGILIGGIVGAVVFWRTIHRQLPGGWREEIRPRR